MSIEPGSAAAWTRAANRRVAKYLSRPPPRQPARNLETYSAPTAPARLLGRVPGIKVEERALDGQRSLRGALGVVLLRLCIAEERHQPVAEPLQHMTAKPSDRSRRFVEISVDEVAPVLGVKFRSNACRADKIAEHLP